MIRELGGKEPKVNFEISNTVNKTISIISINSYQYFRKHRIILLKETILLNIMRCM